MTAEYDVLKQADTILAGLERGDTLPAAWYTDSTMFRCEAERIFRSTWQYAGHVSLVREPGQFLTLRTCNVPLLVVRDLEGELRAFINVCRHRASQLVLEAGGCKKSIQCHYHAWTYNLDGSLRAAPGSADEPDFDKEDYPLIPAQVDTWGPFLFVNPDLNAPSLQSVLGDLTSMIQATGLDFEAIKVRERRSYPIEANWKVVVENYLECYHCPVAHPAFSDLIDVRDYHIQTFDYFSTQSAAMRGGARNGRDNPYPIGAGVEEGFYVFLWPNFTVNIYPGPGNVSLNLILPVDENRTLMQYEFCFVDAVSEAESREFVAFVDQVQREDTVLCESVQRGLRSGFIDRGRLMLSRESALQHFQQLVYRELCNAPQGCNDSGPNL